ncbi:MAG: DegT/DnrJ/EryC1/StrS family aminotransferase [Burkholderiales bacterium]
MSLSNQDYPRETIPKHPVLSAATFGRGVQNGLPSLLDAGDARWVSKGRTAIALALKHAGVGRNDEVLVPAYHCISMIEPIVLTGARPIFYQINRDTSINLNDILARLAPSAKALLAAHYFGFPQDVVKLRAFCDEHQLLLIEDCAHAFFGSVSGNPLGSFGDYAIGSAWKFFPVQDGGCLVSSRRSLHDIALKASALSDAKALLNALEYAFGYQRLALLRRLLPLKLKDRIWKKIKTDTYDETSLQFTAGADFVCDKISAASKFIIILASKARMVGNRRANYLKLLRAVGNLPGSRALFPDLPENVAPYVFPLWIETPERVFSELKRSGVPVIRFGEFLWQEMDRTTCPISVDLSRRVFQFPCHQDLTAQELDWMIARIRDALQ